MPNSHNTKITDRDRARSCNDLHTCHQTAPEAQPQPPQRDPTRRRNNTRSVTAGGCDGTKMRPIIDSIASGCQHKNVYQSRYCTQLACVGAVMPHQKTANCATRKIQPSCTHRPITFVQLHTTLRPGSILYTTGMTRASAFLRLAHRTCTHNTSTSAKPEMTASWSGAAAPAALPQAHRCLLPTEQLKSVRNERSNSLGPRKTETPAVQTRNGDYIGDGTR